MPTHSKAADPTEVQSLTHELSRENSPASPVVQELRRQVANTFVLYANYKHYHWQTYGPLFRDLHKLFDEFAHDVLATLDELAERVRMIGQDPPSHHPAFGGRALRLKTKHRRRRPSTTCGDVTFHFSLLSAYLFR
jgi:DNA-binding ferritin-like protein